jgi:hypothetical protein
MVRLLSGAGISSRPERDELRKNFTDFRVEESDGEILIVCDSTPSNRV